MWWRWCILFLVQTPIILTKNVHHTSQPMECCPCPKDGEITSVNEPSPDSNPGDVSDCVCTPRLGDSEPAASADTIRHFKSVLRDSKSNDNTKPLLHPEVDLASSVLQTLQQATDEEYREALERDAARIFVKEATTNEERLIDPPTNLVTIVLNNPNTYDMDDTAGEESHVHEARCTPHLENKLSLTKTKSTVLEDLLQPPKFNQNIFDQGLAPSNVRSNVVPGFKASENQPNLFSKLKIPDFRISPVINRFSEAENSRNAVMNPVGLKTKSVFDKLSKFPSEPDSEIGASNVNEVMKNNQVYCDESLLTSKSKQTLKNSKDISSPFTIDGLTKLHQAHMEDLTTKIRNGNEKIANLLLEPFTTQKQKVDIQIEPMNIEPKPNARNNDLRKDADTEPSMQYEMIDTSDTQLPRTSLTDSNINRKDDFRNIDTQTKQVVKEYPPKTENTLLNNDENCVSSKKIKSDKYINDEDLETMSNTLLMKSMKLESKQSPINRNIDALIERNNANDRDDNNLLKACSHESLNGNLKSDANEGASNQIMKTVPYTQKNSLTPNKLRNKLIVQPDSIGDAPSLFKLDNPLKLKLPSFDVLKESIEDTPLFNIKNPLNLELPSVYDIRDRLDDSNSLFTINNPISLELPTIDEIRDRVQESAINFGLPSVDDIRDKLEDVSLLKINNPINLVPNTDKIKENIKDFLTPNSEMKIPSLDLGQMITSPTESKIKSQFSPLKLPQFYNNKDGFNLELFRLNPVISPLGKESGLNLDSFRTSVPQLKGLPLKPLKLESFRETNGNMIGASLSLNDIDSHFKKIKSEILRSPTLKQIKKFTNNPKLITSTTVPTTNFDSIGRKSSNTLKNSNFHPFESIPKPLQASIKVPTLKPLSQQSLSNIMTTPNTPKFKTEQMDPIIKAAIINTLTNSRITETTTTKKPKIAKIITPDKTLRTSSLKEPTVKNPLQGILDNNSGLKALHDLINNHKPITLKDIGSLRKINSGSEKESNKDATKAKPMRLRQRIHTSKKKENMEETTVPKVKTVKLSPKHNKFIIDEPLATSRQTIPKPLSLTKEAKLGNLNERKRPEKKLAHLLLPNVDNNKLSLLKSWPSKSIHNLSDLRGSADTSRPVVICNDDNDVGSSINNLVIKKPSNLNRVLVEENSSPEEQINKDEISLTCKEENLADVQEQKLPTENLQHNLETTVVEKLREATLRETTNPLSLTKDPKLVKLFEQKMPENKLPHLLFPKADNNEISSVKTWPSKSIDNQSDLRGSASRPVVICNDDNDVGLSNNNNLIEKPSNLNRASAEESSSPETQINKDEGSLTCKENVESIREQELSTENSQRKLVTPSLEKLREGIKTSFDELNTRVTDNLKRLKVGPKKDVVRCETSPENDSIVEPTNVVRAVTKADNLEKDKLVEGREQELPKTIETVDARDKSFEIKEDLQRKFAIPVPEKLREDELPKSIGTDDEINAGDKSFELKENSQRKLATPVLEKLREGIKTSFDELNNRVTDNLKRLKLPRKKDGIHCETSPENDSIVEPTNVVRTVTKPDNLEKDKLVEGLEEELPKTIETDDARDKSFEIKEDSQRMLAISVLEKLREDELPKLIGTDDEINASDKSIEIQENSQRKLGTPVLEKLREGVKTSFDELNNRVTDNLKLPPKKDGIHCETSPEIDSIVEPTNVVRTVTKPDNLEKDKLVEGLEEELPKTIETDDARDKAFEINEDPQRMLAIPVLEKLREDELPKTIGIDDEINASDNSIELKENSQRKLATPVLEKLREGIKNSFDELNNRVTDNLKRLKLPPKKDGIHCETSPEIDSIIEPTNVVRAVTKPDNLEKGKLVEERGQELPKTIATHDEINASDKSFEVKENDPCDGGMQTGDEFINKDNKSAASIEDNSQVEELDLKNSNEKDFNEVIETLENISDESTNEVKNERETDSIVEPTNIETYFKPITELNGLEDIITKNNNDSEEKSVVNCEDLNNANSDTEPKIISASSNEEIDNSSSEDTAETIENELNNKNEETGLLDKVRNHLHTSLQSIVKNNNIEPNSKIREDSGLFANKIETNTLPLNEGFNNLLERIKSSLQFMNKDDNSKERSEADESSDASDSTFEASNNVPAIENMNENEPKSENLDCGSIGEELIDLPSSLCGKGIPNEGDISYKCRLICTKD